MCLMDSDPPLSDEQAVDAIKHFYEFSTPELWEGGKPSTERVEMVAGALVKRAPADLRPAVAALVSNEEGSLPARAEVCRFILTQLGQSPAFKPAVDRAIESARKPHMFIIDPVSGMFIIAILLTIERNPDGIATVIRSLNLQGLLHELPEVLRALPEGVLKALLHDTGG
jgi:hypothetical protein